MTEDNQKASYPKANRERGELLSSIGICLPAEGRVSHIPCTAQHNASILATSEH